MHLALPCWNVGSTPSTRSAATILLVEQNANLALEISRYGYVLETGHMVLEGPYETLLADDSELARRSDDIEAYFELAAEFLERNKIPNPKAEARKAAAAEAQASGKTGKTVRFWPYG